MSTEVQLSYFSTNVSEVTETQESVPTTAIAHESDSQVGIQMARKRMRDAFMTLLFNTLQERQQQAQTVLVSDVVLLWKQFYQEHAQETGVDFELTFRSKEKDQFLDKLKESEVDPEWLAIVKSGYDLATQANRVKSFWWRSDHRGATV